MRNIGNSSARIVICHSQEGGDVLVQARSGCPAATKADMFQWLHYLVDYLLHRSDLKKPKPTVQATTTEPTARRGRPPKNPAQKAQNEAAYLALVTVEGMLAEAMKGVQAEEKGAERLRRGLRAQVARKKEEQEDSAGMRMGSAAMMVEWCKERGWAV